MKVWTTRGKRRNRNWINDISFLASLPPAVDVSNMLIYLCFFVYFHNLCFIERWRFISNLNLSHFAISRFHFTQSPRWSPTYDNTKDFSFEIIARWLFHNFFFVPFQEFRSEMFEMLSRHRSIGLGEAGAGARVPSCVLRMRPVRPTALNRWTICIVRW